MNGVIIINKPPGYTSFDVVAVLRGVLQTKKIGHTGTLDPMASGVLPVLVGKAAKAGQYLPDEDKAYRAQFALGLTTDTLDSTGKVTGKFDDKATAEQVQAALGGFLGAIKQVPPMYAAVKIGGKKLYELARAGVEVERPARDVTVHTLELASFDEQAQTGVLELSCSKGTYVRSLIDDLGRALNTGGIMTGLVRTRACGFSLEDAQEIEAVKAMGVDAEALLRPVESLFMHLPVVNVTDGQAIRFQNGGGLATERLTIPAPSPLYRVCGAAGFLGLGRMEADELKVEKLF